MELTSLQYHLYQNPLYNFVDKADNTLNMVFIGFAEGAQSFLDLCLQVMQCRSEKFTATVICADELALEYLYKRPELENFFSIDGHSVPDSYGNILFKTPASLEEILRDIKANYIFIDTGDDTANKSTAIACSKILKTLNWNACVSFIWRGDKKQFPRKIVPVLVNDKSKYSDFRRELERMAFNVHIVWSKDFYVEHRELKKTFSKPYYREACLGTVLAIKYKLNDFGADNENLTVAAKNFSKLIFTAQARNEFINAEHKRWVTEKICAGWRRRPIEDCASGVTKDNRTKTHVCLVRSRADRRLHDKFKPEDWGTLTNANLREFDELDVVSIELHKLFAKQALKAKKDPDLITRLLDNISATLVNNQQALTSFQELKVCFEEIFNGDGTKLRLYQNLRDIFLRKIHELPVYKTKDIASNKDIAKKVEENFATFEEKTRLIRLALEYRDYKEDDAAMVENIPFILTYSERTCLIVPLVMGKTTEIFKNVAAATIINPQKIIYAAFCPTCAEIAQIQDCVPKLLDYMARKNLKAKFEFIIACTDSKIDFERETRLLKTINRKKITDVRFVQISNTSNPAPEVIQIFQKFFVRQTRKKTCDLTALEVNNTTVSNWLQGGGICSQVPAYSFDVVTMKFTDINHCETFSYITKKNFITANDLTALNHSFGNIGEQPTFYEDYKDLWSKYCERGGYTWKRLCALLKKYSETADIIATLSRNPTAVDRYRYILPNTCSNTTQSIIKRLASEAIIKETSRVNTLNSNDCEVIIVDMCSNQAEYDKLFSNPYRLMQSKAITFAPKSQTISILSDNLLVENLDCSTEGNDIIKLLTFFRDKNYLTRLNIENKTKISFTYASHEIKSLLTQEGKMLEIYVYHEAKSSGYFDDVVANFEPYWNSTNVHNELDCVLTKNFRVLLVECKATNNIDQAVYFKLNGLAEKFGINTKAVLVVGDNRPLGNEIKKRGDELNIITLQENLTNIGKILSDMI